MESGKFRVCDAIKNKEVLSEGKTQKTQSVFSKPNKPDNDNDNENDNENDNVKDKYNISISSSSEMRGEVSSDCYSEELLQFWKAYPKKMGKGAITDLDRYKEDEEDNFDFSIGFMHKK